MVSDIYVGDFLELEGRVPDGSVDLVLTDPPYGVSSDVVIVREGGKFGHAKAIDGDKGAWDHQVVPVGQWVPVALRKLKQDGVFISFYDGKRITDLVAILESSGMKVRHVGVFVKRNPPPQARKVAWMIGCEHFVIATRGNHHYVWQEGQHADYIIAPVCGGNERLRDPFHPTQKPEAVIEPLIRWWSHAGDVVLYPFAGTGTTLAVATRLGREAVGFELDPRWEPIIRRRMRTMVGQTFLADANKP